MQTQVVVLGGGATGAGVLRDLALRGISAILIDRDGLGNGTSGRCHGLLHSGARYVVKDNHAAQECIAENRILKRVAPDSVEETGGVFVATKDDDPEYIDLFLKGCKEAGIDAEEVSMERLHKDEPHISLDAVRAFYVPDAVVDTFTLVWSNVEDAKKHGAKVLQYTEVTNIIRESGKVIGVRVRDKATGEGRIIHCQCIVNATGAWVNQTGALAGQKISVTPDLGTLLIFNQRLTDRVVNHLCPPDDGDIMVPHGNVSIFGTTSTSVSNPDENKVRDEDVSLLMKKGSLFLRDLDSYRMIRAFAGVRPLYSAESATGRAATREFVLIDHKDTDGEGMISVCGGKLTTYRLMAQQTVDYVCTMLGITAECTTHTDIMHSPVINDGYAESKYLCKCENVTEEMLDKAFAVDEHYSLSDIRRLTRLGMGPCQGTFCTYRATGYFNKKHNVDTNIALGSLKNHVEERLKGTKAVLFEKQASETEFMRAIYLGLLNLEREEYDYKI